MVLLPFQDGYQDNFAKVTTFNPEQPSKASKRRVGHPARTGSGSRMTSPWSSPTSTLATTRLARQSRVHRRHAQEHRRAAEHPAYPIQRVLGDRHRQAVRHVLLRDLPDRPVRHRLHLPELLLGQHAHQVRAEQPDAGRTAASRQPAAHPQEQYAKANEVETEAFKTYGVMPRSTGRPSSPTSRAWPTTAPDGSPWLRRKPSAGRSSVGSGGMSTHTSLRAAREAHKHLRGRLRHDRAGVSRRDGVPNRRAYVVGTDLPCLC